MIGNPFDQADYWQLQIEPDNCAVAAETSILNQFGIDLSQEDACYISASHGWYQPGEGTSPDEVGNLMDLYNIPNHRVMNATVQDLAAELRQGHGVIVGVRSDQLWDTGSAGEFWNWLCKASGLDTPEFSPADHAVVVTGINTSDPSNPMVILNDSGDPNGQAHSYPLDRFMDAWQNSDFYYTATDQALPSGMQGVESLPFWSMFASAAVGTYTFLETGDLNSAVAAGCAAGSLVENFFSDDSVIANL